VLDGLTIELFKHQARLAHATGVTDDELVEVLQALVNRLEFVNESPIPLGIWMEVHRLCKDVDERDTPYVALTLHLDGRLRAEDAELKQGLCSRRFTNFFEPGKFEAAFPCQNLFTVAFSPHERTPS